MKLSEFLEFFDFGAEIAVISDPGEREHRLELVKSGELDEADIEKPMFRFIDYLGANLGRIEDERWLISGNHDKGFGGLAEAVVERLTIYLQDYIIANYEEKLEKEGVQTSRMNLEKMVEKAKEIGLDMGCVAEYAEAAIHPDSILVDLDMREEKK